MSTLSPTIAPIIKAPVIKPPDPIMIKAAETIKPAATPTPDPIKPAETLTYAAPVIKAPTRPEAEPLVFKQPEAQTFVQPPVIAPTKPTVEPLTFKLPEQQTYVAPQINLPDVFQNKPSAEPLNFNLPETISYAAPVIKAPERPKVEPLEFKPFETQQFVMPTVNRTAGTIGSTDTSGMQSKFLQSQNPAENARGPETFNFQDPAALQKQLDQQIRTQNSIANAPLVSAPSYVPDINQSPTEMKAGAAPRSQDAIQKALEGKVLVPGSREWVAMQQAQAGKTPQEIAALNAQNQNLAQLDAGAGTTNPQFSQVSITAPQKSQYDLIREQIRTEEARNRQMTEEQLKQQLASRGLGAGTGFGEKALQKAQAEAARTQAGRMSQVDIAQAAAAEQAAEAEKARTFQASQADLDRQLQRDVQQGNISMQEKELALNAAQFTSKQDYDAWALQSGYDQAAIDRSWQSAENAKNQLFQQSQTTQEMQFKGSEAGRDRELQLQLQAGELNQADKELAQQAFQFKTKTEFDTWATQQGFDENARNRAWEAAQNADERAFQAEQAGFERAFKASEAGLERGLQLQLQAGTLSQADKELAQQAYQFKTKVDYDTWATKQGFDENARERAWTAAQTADAQAFEAEQQAAQNKFQQDLAVIENDFALGRMNRADQIDDLNKLDQQLMDAAFKMGANNSLKPEDIAKLTPLQQAAYQAGLSGMQYEVFTTDRDAQVSYRNALISRLDPNSANFQAQLDEIFASKAPAVPAVTPGDGVTPAVVEPEKPGTFDATTGTYAGVTPKVGDMTDAANIYAKAKSGDVTSQAQINYAMSKATDWSPQMSYNSGGFWGGDYRSIKNPPAAGSTIKINGVPYAVTKGLYKNTDVPHGLDSDQFKVVNLLTGAVQTATIQGSKNADLNLKIA